MTNALGNAQEPPRARFRPMAPVLALCLLAATAARAVDAPEVIFKRAETLNAEGQITKAVEAFRDFLAAYPAHSQAPEAHYRLAKCLDGMARVDEAIEHLRKATEKQHARFRNRQDALRMLGKALGEMKNFDEAAEVFETLLAEGAGLYEEEVMNLCGGYYALAKKYDEAAIKFSILSRRSKSRYAERAAQKLVLLWIEADKPELAVEALSELVKRFPKNADAPGLMLRLAALYQEKKDLDRTIAICDQIRARYSGTREAFAAGYLVGLSLRERKQFDQAVKVLLETGRNPENMRSGIAAEAMIKAAEIYEGDLGNVEQARNGYEEAANLARDYADEDRRRLILEKCYFWLGEHYFRKAKWGVALEFYSLLRKAGTSINILPRIMKCQSELNINMDAFARRDAELQVVRDKIAANPGTFIAAEGEVFLADRQLSLLKAATRNTEPYRRVAEAYRHVLSAYPGDILSQFNLESYVYVQLGHCLAAIFESLLEASGPNDEWQPAVKAFRQAIEVDDATPYRQECLEWIARIADAAGRKRLAFETYRELYELTGRKVEDNTADAQTREAMSGYLRSMLTRAQEADSIDKALAMCDAIIQNKGVGSAAARHALFYKGELYYISKDFSQAAKTYRQFIRTYGPPQNADGDVAKGPWKPAQVDDTVKQVFDASRRIAQCWYLQGHGQNMRKAYDWMIRNFPHQNPFLAEAHYWLETEKLEKSSKPDTEAEKIKAAHRLWDTIVSPDPLSILADDKASRTYHPWVRDNAMSAYVKPTLIKCGELLSSAGDHALSAEAFRTFMALYPPPRPDPRSPAPPPPPDKLYRIARYAIGQEYVGMNRIDLLGKVYKPYLTGERDDPFRLPGLRCMGFYFSQAPEDEGRELGVEAYVTILDEYGSNRLGKDGKPMPVPRDQRIRKGDTGWNGIRLPPPEGLDLGQIRFSLGHLYWNNKEWDKCAPALRPFIDNPDLAGSESRGRALFMLGKSLYKLRDFWNGARALRLLIEECPDFEAIDEVYVDACRGYAEEKRWEIIEWLYRQFREKHVLSRHRSHMDLYMGIAEFYSGKFVDGQRRLRELVRGNAYEDVKADACYHLGLAHLMTQEVSGAGNSRFKPVPSTRNHEMALEQFERSIMFYPRAKVCLAGAKSAIALGQWDRARVLLNMTLTEFTDAPPDVTREAKSLLPGVLKKLSM